MSPKPLIGCTTYRKTANQDPPIDLVALPSSYIRAIEAAGGIPIMIPLGLSDEDLLALFDRIDGVLLPGGGDVDPAFYGSNAYDLVRRIDKDRDRIELLLARTSVHQQKPLLAICRGHQVLNVALGGTLWDDISSLVPGALKHDNFDDCPRNYLAHTVTVVPDSHLARCLGVGETAVNSMHHQAVRDLAPDLAVTATSSDGLIEGLEATGHPFAVGVQWHPENLVADDPKMLALFEGFVAAACLTKG